jgi:hypothetical protein
VLKANNVALPAKPKKGAGKGKKARKYGRNRVWCEAYRRAGRREANKARRAARRARWLAKRIARRS